MTITVDGPNGVSIDFPDGTDNATIDSVMRQATGQGGGAQQPSAEPMSTGRAGLVGFMRGATFGGLDELHGANRAAPTPAGIDYAAAMGGGMSGMPPETTRLMEGVGRVAGGAPGAQQQYEQGRDQARAIQDQARREHPIASGIGEVAGGLATGAALPVLSGTTIPRMIGAGMVTGAGYGAANGFLEGEGSPGDRLLSAGRGAVGGAVVGGAVGGAIGGGQRIYRNVQAGRVADEAGLLSPYGQQVAQRMGLDAGTLTPEAVQAMQAQMRRTGVSPEAARAAMLGEQGVTPTRANLTQTVGDFRNQRRAEFADGPVARATEAQQEAFDAARNAMGQQFAGGVDRAATTGQAAEQVQRGVARSADRARDMRDAAYRIFDETSAAVHPDAMVSAPQQITQGLRNAAEPIVLSAELHPAASQMMRRIEEMSVRVGREAEQHAADPTVAAFGFNTAGMAQLRRELVSARRAAVTPEDRRAATAVMRQYDNWMEGALTNQFLSGDRAALEALRAANQQHAIYRQTFGQQGRGDAAGKMMEQLSRREDVTPTEVANLIFGTTRIGERGDSVRFVQRLRTALGSNSPEFQAVRQAAWMRMLSEAGDATQTGANAANAVTSRDPGRQVSNIIRFIDGEGGPMARALFSQAELDQMRRYAQAQRLTVAPRDATNGPNSGLFTGETIQRAAPYAGASIGSAIGGAIGGPIGGAIGTAGGAIGGWAGVNIANALRSSRALSAPRSGMPTYGVPAAVLGSQPLLESIGGRTTRP